MNKPDKATRQRIAALRSSRQDWIRGDQKALHFGYCITCSHTAPEPGCEGCCAKQYRADRVAEIENEIRRLAGKPDMYRQPAKTKPRVEQLPLFA